MTAHWGIPERHGFAVDTDTDSDPDPDSCCPKVIAGEAEILSGVDAPQRGFEFHLDNLRIRFAPALLVFGYRGSAFRWGRFRFRRVGFHYGCRKIVLVLPSFVLAAANFVLALPKIVLAVPMIVFAVTTFVFAVMNFVLAVVNFVLAVVNFVLAVVNFVLAVAWIVLATSIVILPQLGNVLEVRSTNLHSRDHENETHDS